jgi:hypothetical protein
MSLPEGTKYGQHRGTYQTVYGSPTGRTSAGGGAITPGDPLKVTVIRPSANPELHTLENAGIRAGSIIAHRMWIYRAGISPGLRSLAMICYWPETGLMTGDVSTYGVYSFNSEEHLKEHKAGVLTLPFLIGGLTAVFGTVAIWGQVVEHERGYRSEFARIKSLTSAIGIDKGDLPDIRAYYKV